MYFKNLSKFIILPLFSAIVALSIGVYSNEKESQNEKVPLDRLIAHAGGEVYGIRITNSLQALDNSYEKGFRFFELDFEWTSDGVPVILHDWGHANWFFNIKYSTKAHTYKEFKNLKPILGLKIMDLKDLSNWLENHKDAYIITDVKSENIKLLQLLEDDYPNIKNQIIPQIYSFDQYDKVKNLGYSNIILTLYKLEATDEEILNFCKETDLLAVTMYESKGFTDLPKKLSEIGIKSYVHTINDYNVYVKLRDNGVFGVYTDYFQPNNWVE